MAILKFSSVVIVFILSLLIANAAAEIYTSNTATALGQSSREPKYRTEFHPEKSPFHPDDGQESMVMTNKDGQKYTCFLPTVEETKTMTSIAQHNSSSIVIETEHRVKSKTPDELLDILKDKGCFYRHEGWWSYEFCHLKHLKQVHTEDDKVVQEFFLGVFDEEATATYNQNHSANALLKDPRSKDASQRYHAHVYTNGTICDLTGEPRETEVRFVCSEPTVIISSLKEISTCKYVVTIQCPLLCKHPMFKQERPMWHTIHCNEMPNSGKVSSIVENDKTKGTQITAITDDSNLHAT